MDAAETAAADDGGWLRQSRIHGDGLAFWCPPARFRQARCPVPQDHARRRTQPISALRHHFRSWPGLMTAVRTWHRPSAAPSMASAPTHPRSQPSRSRVSAIASQFVEYFGVGHGSGVCESGFPPNCPHKITPWVLHDAGNQAWNLTLGNYEEDYPVGLLNTAQIAAVPEPSIYALMLAGLSGFARSVRRGPRRHQGIG